LAVTQTLAHRGSVFAITDSPMPNLSPLAAILRMAIPVAAEA
jgi:hypothetical protein